MRSNFSSILQSQCYINIIWVVDYKKKKKKRVYLQYLTQMGKILNFILGHVIIYYYFFQHAVFFN